MAIGLRLALLAAFVTLLAGPAIAQRKWYTKYFGAGVISDTSVASAPDGAGGFFVAGSTEGTLGGPSAGDADTWLARYDGEGNRIWIRQFGSSSPDYVHAAATDGAGGVYLAGSTYEIASFHDAWLTRCDAAGNQIWSIQLATSSSDEATCASPDGAGGVYVGGYTYGSLGGPNLGEDDAWLARYDASGNQNWILQLGTGSWDDLMALATDGAGGAFAGGRTEGSLGGSNAGSSDAWLARYDGAGNRTWVRQLGTAGWERIGTAAADGVGGFFVSGETSGDLASANRGETDAWVARYDGGGNPTWIRQFGTSEANTPYAAAADGNDGVYVGGWVGLWAGHAWLAHYDAAANQTWVRVLAAGEDDCLQGATPDGAGGVFVNGWTNGSLAARNEGGMDAWLARYDIAGAQTWARQFGESDREAVLAATPDDAGGAFVGGMTDGDLAGTNAGMLDGWVGRIDGDVESLWFVQLGTAGEDSVLASASDDAGGVFVGGSTEGALGGPNAGGRDGWLARYDGGGSQLWILQVGTGGDDALAAAATDGSGGTFVGGFTTSDLGGPSAGGSDAWLARYDGTGNPLWIRQLGSVEDDVLHAAAADGAGGVYVAGETKGSLDGTNAGDADAWLARYDGSGNLSWIRQLGTSARDSVAAAAPDAAGGVYVGGETLGSLGAANAGDADAWLARFDGAGNALWVQQFGTSERDSLDAATARTAIGVYVGGETYGQFGPVSYRGNGDTWHAFFNAAGARLWTQQEGWYGHDALLAIVPIPADDDLFCAGTYNYPGTADAWIGRYNNYEASATIRNGLGVNRLCFTSTTLPVRGGAWTADIDTSGHPGAIATMIRAHQGPGTPGSVTPYGQILVSLSTNSYFVSLAVPDGAGIGHHSIPIPASVSLVFSEITVFTQGCILGGVPELCNAIDIVLGS